MLQMATTDWNIPIVKKKKRNIPIVTTVHLHE